jgi:hypothetical protein
MRIALITNLSRDVGLLNPSTLHQNAQAGGNWEHSWQFRVLKSYLFPGSVVWVGQANLSVVWLIITH